MIEVLPRLYQRVIVPQAVWEEVTEKGAGLPGAIEVSMLQRVNRVVAPY